MRSQEWKSFEVLVVDDEEDNLDAFRFSFRKAFSLHYALGGQQALDMLERIDAAVVVSDQRMPGLQGIDFLRAAKERRPDAFGILLTAYADLPVLIDAINSGAVDRYIQKPWDSKELTVVLRQGIDAFATIRENRKLREQLAHYAGYLEREQRDPLDFGELACESDAMKEVARQIDEVAPTSSPVVIECEPGGEQEIVARAIHTGSPREEFPFVRVTCAAFRGPALERELFGWRRHAFEEAYADRAGRLELADRGTIYLDAPEPPSPSLSARLVRLLTDGEVERVGGTEAHAVNVRPIIAVHGPLAEAWGGVLPELVSKLAVFPIRLAPLRERKQDLPILAQHFLRKYARRNARAATSLSISALAELSKYDFPGNARELENVIERAAIVSRGDVIEREHLDFEGRAARVVSPAAPLVEAPPLDRSPNPGGRSLDTRLDELERRELLAALEASGGNKAEVARRLGVQRTTLYYRLKRLGIDA